MDRRRSQTAATGLCTRNVSRALIERPYSREPQAVGAVYDRPGFFVQSPCRLTPNPLLLTLSNRLHIGVFVYEQVVLRDLLDENMGDCVRINEAPVFLFQQNAGERSLGSDKHPTKIIFLDHLFPTGPHGDDV